MWVLDSVDHCFLAANREAQRLYGFSLNQLTGMAMKDVLVDPYPEIKDHKTGLGRKNNPKAPKPGRGDLLS